MKNSSVTSVREYLLGKILETDEIESFLNALTHLAVRELSGGEPERVLCGITLVRNRRAGTVASSSLDAQELDEVQYGLGEGPCLTAARERAIVVVPDLRVEQRWPGYVRHLISVGIRSVLAVPFQLEDGDGAALNLYSRDVDGFAPRQVETARGYADRASQAFAVAVKVARHREESEHLLEAMKTRTTIDLAVGIIMGQNRRSQEEAFRILRAASNSRNIKLRDVAAGVVGSVSPEAPATHFDT